ncbi:hypothetical protein ACHAXA_001140 [Cyclostephanos tholiformis]|uniref:Uncharacterized protein n=1 Tax=Cyclostephanos tholiformis TaxID=382380 RepID=A0ABD3R785_9STRA
MADLSSSGRVQSADQIRIDRERKGLCTTCRNDQPVKCFEIKKRLGFVKKIPLSEVGKVEQGTCLICHPHHDPRMGRAQDPLTSNVAFGRDAHSHRDRVQSHYQLDRGQPFPLGGDPLQGNDRSMPNLRKPTRQANFRLSKSLPLDALDSYDEIPWDVPRGHQHREEEYVNDIGIGRRSGSNPKLHMETGRIDRHANMGNASSTSQYSKKYGASSDEHNYTAAESFEEKLEGHASENNVRHPTYSRGYAQSLQSERERNYSGGIHREIPKAQDAKLYPSTYDYRRGDEMDDRKLPSVSTFPKRGDFSNSHQEDNLNVQLDSRLPPHFDPFSTAYAPSGDDENDAEKLPRNSNLAEGGDSTGSDLGSDAQFDNLQKTIRDYFKMNPNKPIKFVPNEGGVVLPNSELQLEEADDDPSVLTQDTYLRDMGSVATMGTRINTDSRMRLVPIDESASVSSSHHPHSELSSFSSSHHQRSMISHQRREPTVPYVAASPVQIMESYMQCPDLKALSEFIEMCNTTGLDEDAIEALTTSLIQDNDDAVKSTSTNTDLAVFCLTKLWVLAGKSDDNKRMMIFDENNCAGAYSSFEAVKETAKIYRGSYEVQQGVCAVLWSLSMKYQNHVVQNDGCMVILDAIKIHVKDAALQVMALGALKVMTFDSVGQSMLLSQGCLSIVADVMQTHLNNSAIQSLGCVILGNLALDEASQSAITVSEKEVSVVINGMVAHPNSLEVHEAA